MIATGSILNETDVDRAIAVVRLGDADRLGWWRSRSLDDVAEYVLGAAFPNSWRASGVELALESARIRHDSALGRASAAHLFSDQLPFAHVLRMWLVTTKYERQTKVFENLAVASKDELLQKLGGTPESERRDQGLFLGEVRAEDLHDEGVLRNLFSSLTGAYGSLGNDFAAPYFDVVS